MTSGKIRGKEVELRHKGIEQLNIEELLKNKKNILKIKRIFDMIASGIGIIIISPIFLIVSILIKITSEGPVFFKQIRVGKDEVNFEILKFRTMVIDAEKKGMQITVGNDPRITKIGYFLRKTKLDELPQLINVFKGEMSLVGPRPEVPKYVAYYTEEQKCILKIRPGITDLASIEYRNENEVLKEQENPESYYIEVIMKDKINLNIENMKKLTILNDIKIIVKTVQKCFV